MTSMAAVLPRRAARAFFRHHVENGISVALCLAAVVLATGFVFGTGPAIFAATGAMCTSIVDQPGPLGGRVPIFASALVGTTLVSLLAGLAGGTPPAMAAVVALTSLGLAMATALGRPALMLGIAGVLALIIGMAIPEANAADAMLHSAEFFAGGLAYGALATLTAWVTDDRTRRMFLNEALLAFASYLRARARLYDGKSEPGSAIAAVIEAHGALMDRLQAARDTIFTGETRPERQRWIGGMIALLDLYEAVLSSDADWEALRRIADGRAVARIAALTECMAEDIDAIALALVSPGTAMPACDHDAMLAALNEKMAALGEEERAALRPTRDKLARALRRVARLAAVTAEGGTALAVPESVDIAAFVQPAVSPLATLKSHLRFSSPVMRYAIRLTAAMLVGYAITIAIPRYVHGGWILLTIALIMRASYAITLQRRNDRILGTLAGCAAAAVLLPILPVWAIVAGTIIGVGLAHAYAAVNYKITSFTASMMALMLLHFLEPQTFFVADRIIDTLIGALLAWAFARVLPSWEWRDMPRLVRTLVEADRRFAEQALAPAPGDQDYRLARKQALDAFTALATTVRRLSSEPKGHAAAMTALGELLAANYLFASDLASVQNMLRARGEEIAPEEITAMLADAKTKVLENLDSETAPPPETLRRRGWMEMTSAQAMTVLRRRLLHIEHSAARVAAQAKAAAGHEELPADDPL